MKFDTSILREADIRGVYPEQINSEFAKRLGCVFGTFAQKKGKSYCVVGHDNRFGGPDLTKNLIEGLISTGINVMYIGLVTTPMFNFASHSLGHEYGIMVTASHNPSNDNGFKIFGANYQHCDYDELETIYEGLKSGKVGAAGVDVYEQEPPEKDMPILSCPNVVLQPHSSSETWESKEAVSVDCAQCVIDALEGRKPKTALN